MTRGRASAWLLAALFGLVPLGAVSPASAAASERDCIAALFCIETVQAPGRLELWLEGLGDRPLTVAVELVLLGAETQRHRHKAVLRSPARRRLFALPVADPGRALFRWSFSFHPGQHPQAHDDATVYRLPYGPGSRFRVIQGPDSGFTHRGRDRHGIDWALPQGTLVRAARGGRVIGRYQDAAPGGASGEHLGRDNFVWIEHDDGTVGWYAHLKRNSLLVAQGDRVEAGAPLGRAGASGFASEPHLHFQVSTPSHGEDAYETLPVVFELGPGRVGTPAQGETYPAPRDD